MYTNIYMYIGARTGLELQTPPALAMMHGGGPQSLDGLQRADWSLQSLGQTSVRAAISLAYHGGCRYSLEIMIIITVLIHTSAIVIIIINIFGIIIAWSS